MTRTGDGGQKAVAEARPEAVMRHHRAAWRVERIAWATMALLLLGAVLGAFGGGPLSHARSGSPEAVQLEYQRLLRAAAPTEYRLLIQPSFAADGRVAVRIDQALVELMQLESIVPEPDAVAAGAGYTEFSFRIAPDRRSVAHVVLRFKPATFGRFSGELSVDGAPPLAVSHFVYP
ncbi:hypothetical protein [Luteimonas granuli]|uniref:Uncharacterized protein n=1 Tax=Luteimonas granuli TaxID=1176533 RepID=A0A518N4S9_9GAMM|nr:hypothetical protein [Luteimonas granuli]QDW66877.1 hypothetical protein FPZ22_08230 [Luteimonas granuli]